MICLCKLNHVINHTEVTFEVDFWLQYFSTTIQLHILGNPISQCPSQMYIPTSFFHLLSSTGQQKMRKQAKGLWTFLPTLFWAENLLEEQGSDLPQDIKAVCLTFLVVLSFSTDG